MTSTRLSLVVLKTYEVESLRRFYSCLGIAFIEEQHGNGPRHFAGRLGDSVLEIYPLPNAETAADANTRLGFTVAKLGDVARELVAAGATVVSEAKASPWGLRMVVRDPDGRAVELCDSGSTANV